MEINTTFAVAIYRTSQMKQSFRTISFLSIFLFIEGFLLSVSARTETTNKEVLVLNSINFNLPWAKNFYWCIHDALQKQGYLPKRNPFRTSFGNKMEADAVVTHLREKYPVAPAAIVLIGDPGWIVCRELFDDVWKDVPVIVTNARDRLPASLDVLLSHAPLTETNSVLGEEWRRGYNLTLLKQHYYVKETVELIYKLIPDMQRLAFISDDRYISEETRRDVKEAVEENFPDLIWICFPPLNYLQKCCWILYVVINRIRESFIILGLSLIMKMITTTFSTTYRKL